MFRVNSCDLVDRTPTDERAIHEITRRRVGTLAFTPKRSFLERHDMQKRRLIATLLGSIMLSQVGSVMAAKRSAHPLAPATDWSKAVVESTIKRFPTADSLKGWGYAKSLYLYG